MFSGALFIMRRCALLSLVMLSGEVCHGQGFVHRFPLTMPFGHGNAVGLPDGSLMVHYRMNTQWALMRYGLDGEPLWSRRLGTDTEIGAVGAALMPDGSVVLSGSVDWMAGTTRRYSNLRINPDGTAAWGKRYILSGWPAGPGMALPSGTVRLEADAYGSIFTALEHAGEGASGPMLIKAESTGILQWAVDLMEGPAGFMHTRVLPDGQSGCWAGVLITEGEGSRLAIHHYGPTGALSWRMVLRAMEQPASLSAGLARGSDGELIVAGWMSSGAYWLRIAPQGGLLQALHYPLQRIEELAAESALVRDPVSGAFRLGDRQVLTFGSDGGLLRHQWCPHPSDTIGTVIQRVMHHAGQADAFGLVVLGSPWAMNTADMTFQVGFLAGRIPWDALGEGCVFTCGDLPIVPAEPLSNEQFLYGEEPYPGPFSVSHATVDLTVSAWSIPVPATTRDCLELGLPEARPPHALAFPNPVAGGAPITVSVGQALAWRLTDALGRTLPAAVSVQADGLQMATDGLAPGSYVLLVHLRASPSPIAVRFVVQ